MSNGDKKNKKKLTLGGNLTQQLNLVPCHFNLTILLQFFEESGDDLAGGAHLVGDFLVGHVENMLTEDTAFFF